MFNSTLYRGRDSNGRFISEKIKAAPLMSLEESLKKAITPKLKDGGKIHIKPENRGKFTAYANSKGQSVQEAARSVLNNPNASPTLKKRANFARNASKWKHQDGGKLGYDEWKAKYKLSESDDYNLKRAWELGYTPDNDGHLPSVDNKTNWFLKTKNHPTVKKEIDWYQSDDGAEFRKKFKIDSTDSKYYRYVPRLQKGDKIVAKDSVPNEYMLRQLYRESLFKEDAKSGKDAKGLAQFRDITIKELKDKFGVEVDPMDAKQSIVGHKTLMFDLYNKPWITKGDPTDEVRLLKTTAAYNYGPTATVKALNKAKAEGVDIYKDADGIKKYLPKETKNYYFDISGDNPEFEKNYQKAVSKFKYADYYPIKKQKGGVITDGQSNNVNVKQSKILGAGKGLFANKDFKKGSLIGLAHENDQPVGDIGNMHNHSNKPNMYSIKKGNQRYVYAKRDIHPGEELTTDYRQQPELEQPNEFSMKPEMSSGGSFRFGTMFSTNRLPNTFSIHTGGSNWTNHNPKKFSFNSPANLGNKQTQILFNKLRTFEHGGNMTLGSKPNRRDLLKKGVDATLYPLPFKKGGKMQQGGLMATNRPRVSPVVSPTVSPVGPVSNTPVSKPPSFRNANDYYAYHRQKAIEGFSPDDLAAYQSQLQHSKENADAFIALKSPITPYNKYLGKAPKSVEGNVLGNAYFVRKKGGILWGTNDHKIKSALKMALDNYQWGGELPKRNDGATSVPLSKPQDPKVRPVPLPNPSKTIVPGTFKKFTPSQRDSTINSWKKQGKKQGMDRVKELTRDSMPLFKNGGKIK